MHGVPGECEKQAWSMTGTINVTITMNFVKCDAEGRTLRFQWL